MADYDNTNSIVIFKNDKKTNEKAPDYTGKLNVDGVDKDVALWVRESSRDGKKFFSGKINEPYDANASGKPNASPVEPACDLDDDIPF